MKKKDLVATLAVLACASTMGACMIACGGDNDPSTPPASYTIIFDTDGGTIFNSQDVTGGSKIQDPGTPVKVGYEFDGWYTDDGYTQIWTFETDKVTGNLTLYAKWKIKDATEESYFTFTAVGENYAIAVKTGETLPAETVLPDEYNGQAVIAIADGAFEGQTTLKSVKIPTSIKTVGARAFRNCTLLETVSGAENVEELGSAAFTGTKYDNSLPAGVAYIGKALYKYVGTMPANTEIEVKAGTLGIAASAFQDMKNLTKLTLNAELKTIGNYAFGGATDGAGITEVVIPDSVVTIGDNAFRNAKSLVKATIGKNATAIGVNVFTGSPLAEVTYKAVDANVADVFKNLTTEATLTITNDVQKLYAGLLTDWTGLKTVTIGDGVTSLPDSMFDGLTNLKTVTLGNNLENIGSYAFRASGIEKITIPESVTKIGTAAFANCASLAEVEYDAISAEGAPENGISFRTCNALVKVVVGNNVITIPAYLFKDVASLTTLTLGEKVTTIGDKAFYGTGLTALTLPASLRTVGESAFEGAKFTSLTLPADLETVGAKAFANNTALKTVTLNSAALQQQGSVSMFDGCTAIDTLNIGDGVISVPARILQGNSTITAVTLGDDVRSVGDYAFNACANLETVHGYENLTDIGVAAFDGTAWYEAEMNKDGPIFVGTVLTKWNGDLAAAIEIPAKTTAIAADAFTENTNKTKVTTVTFAGEAVEHIGDNVFKGFTALSAIEIPASVKQIGNQTFAGCSALTTLTFETGSKLESVGNQAFYEDNKLSNITFPDSMKSIGDSALYGVGGKVVFGTGCTSLGARLFSTTRVITLDGAYNRIEEVVINGAVTKIPDGFLDGVGNVTKINIPETVTEIGDRAFYSCANLTELDLSRVTSVGVSAFEMCSNLANVNLNPDIASLGNYAFKDTAVTGELTFNLLTSVPERAFENANVLKLTFKKILSLGNNAFASNKLLAEVDFGSTLQTVSGSFYGCNSLTEITLPASVTQIDAYSFPYVQKVYFTGFVNPAVVKLTASSTGNAFSNTVLFMCSHEDYAKYVADSSNWAKNAGSSWETLWKDRFVDQTLFYEDENWSIQNGKVLSYTPSDAYATVVIPKAVSELDSVITIFKTTTNLAKCTSITLEDGNAAFKMENGAILSMDGTKLYWYNGGASALTWNSVTTVMPYAFYNRITTEATLTLPKLTEVSIYSFYGCSGIKTFDFTKLAAIPNYAFYGIGISTLDLAAVTIGNYAFTSCQSLITVTLADVKLGDYSFRNCTSLSSVSITGAMTKLPDYTFSGCTSLTNVTLPDSITEFGRNAFDSCAFEQFTFPKKLVTIGIQTFQRSKLTSVVIPASVETINSHAFYDCSALESVEFETNSAITTLNSEAFSASKVKRLVLPNTLKSVDRGMFGEYLQVLDMSVTTLSGNALYLCYNSPIAKLILRGSSLLETGAIQASGSFAKKDPRFTIYVQDSLVEAYKAHSFWGTWADNIVGLSTLDNNDIPEEIEKDPMDGWTIAEDGTFISYSGDLKNIIIPKELKSLESLESLYGDNITPAPSSIEMITVEEGSTSFKMVNGMLMSYDGKIVYTGIFSAIPTDLDLTGVEEVKPYAFYMNKTIATLYMPDIVRIGKYAFRASTCPCTSITIGDKCTYIGEYALYVKTLNKVNVTIKAVVPPTVDSISFLSGTTATRYSGTIYVPAQSVEAYKAAAYWGDMTKCTIEAITSEIEGNRPALEGWTIADDGTFVSYESSKTSIIIPRELKSLPSIQSLYGTMATSYLQKLESLTVEDGSTSFKMVNGMLMSYDGTVLYCVTMDAPVVLDLAGVTEVKEYACYYVNNKTSVNLPDVVTIGQFAFESCGASVITIGDKCTTLGECSLCGDMFDNNIHLTITAVTPPTVGNMFLDYLLGLYNGKIYVPAESVEAYKAANGWSEFASFIEAIPSDGN